MSHDQPIIKAPTRKPFVNMQIEKVNLRTTETMGIQCHSLSSSSSNSQPNPACSNIATLCHDLTG
jgi:hypothetical protein